jgi:hypothetical protein
MNFKKIVEAVKKVATTPNNMQDLAASVYVIGSHSAGFAGGPPLT